jgi:hypothetical protein
MFLFNMVNIKFGKVKIFRVVTKFKEVTEVKEVGKSSLNFPTFRNDVRTCNRSRR